MCCPGDRARLSQTAPVLAGAFYVKCCSAVIDS